MFYGASPAIFEKAKQLRKNLTLQERLLWEELKGSKLPGLRFKAQHPVSFYIADFYCHKIRLVIEIDGETHVQKDQKEYDKGRAFAMSEFGIETIRFHNEEVEKNIDSVLEKIKLTCLRSMENLNSLLTPTLKREANSVLKHQAPFRRLWANLE